MAAFNRVQPFNLGVNIMKIGEYFDDYEFSCNCERHEVDENGHNVQIISSTKDSWTY